MPVTKTSLSLLLAARVAAVGREFRFTANNGDKYA